MQVSTESLDHGHGVCGAQAAGNRAEGRMKRIRLQVTDRSVDRCEDRMLG